MCEANAYLMEKGQKQLLMEAVDLVEPEGENIWRLVNIFGDQKTVRAKIGRMNLVDHVILFEAQTD